MSHSVTTTVNGQQHVAVAPTAESLPALIEGARDGLTTDGYRYVFQRWSDSRRSSHTFFVREDDDAVATIVVVDRSL